MCCGGWTGAAGWCGGSAPEYALPPAAAAIKSATAEEHDNQDDDQYGCHGALQTLFRDICG